MILKQCLHLKIPTQNFIQIRNKLYDGNGNGWVGLNNLSQDGMIPTYPTRATVDGSILGAGESARKIN